MTMTDRTKPDYSDLIARLEKVTGPDRALGDDVLLACGWGMDEVGEGPDRKILWCGPVEEYLDGDQPDPTSSIDAAMTLVPEGWAWFVQRIGDLPQHPEYSSYGDVRLWIPAQRTKGLAVESVDVRSAPTPAIALCIAALKARQEPPK